MESEEGIVERILKQKAVVRIQQSSKCATCDSRDSCDVSSDKKILIEVANDLQAKIGDLVEISMPENSLLQLSMLVYLLPIIALIAGALVGENMAGHLNTDPNLTAVFSGGAAMALVFIILRWLDHSTDFREKYYPRMTRIITNAMPLSPCGKK